MLVLEGEVINDKLFQKVRLPPYLYIVFHPGFLDGILTRICPPRSPYFAPPDFFFLGHIKYAGMLHHRAPLLQNLPVGCGTSLTFCKQYFIKEVKAIPTQA
jgi:hypothetical protein